MRRLVHFTTLAFFVLHCTKTLSQNAFINSNVRLTSSAFYSGCAVAVVDWNEDGLDDIVKLQYGHGVYVDIQRPGNQYETRFLGDFASGNAGWAWAMCIGDFDNNGYKDIAAGGRYTDLQVMMTNNTGTAGTIYTVPNTHYFIQSMTAGDFNQDGFLDLFVCDDNAASHLYTNDGLGTLSASTLINFDVTPSDDSGNYGSVFTDFDNDGDLDLYIAKCRQTVTDTTDFRRINVLFVNDGTGHYSEMAANYNINIHWQSWTASFGDIDNDGDLDLFVTNHDHPSQILLNDGTGHYSDITSTVGFDIQNMTPLQSVLEDFDNDGYEDILVAGSVARLFHNNHNNTFTEVKGLFNSNHMETFAIGDLNHDGFIDIYSGYATIYTTPSTIQDVLWLNQGNKNHFFSLDLRGTVSNHDGIGARAFIYGTWGVQLRESKAGESYGTSNTAMLHFGLGNATAIDSVVIKWPSGIHQTILNPAIDQFLKVVENDCVSPEAIVANSNGVPVLCTGQTLTLTAPQGMSYNWSNGDTTQSILVSSAGEYLVTIRQAGNNCAANSKLIKVTYNPNQKPAIDSTGSLDFCSGNILTLSGPADCLSYAWSNGDTTQTTTITSSGAYWLNIQGYCQPWTSDTLNVTAHTVSPAFAPPGITIPYNTITTLTATGTNVNWFNIVGGSPIATGNNFTTPNLMATTTYYVANEETFNAATDSAGLIYPITSSSYNGNTLNAITNFDVQKPCILKSVKVYTDTYGIRQFELWDGGNHLLDSLQVNITSDSAIVNLNFNLPVGAGYILQTNSTINGQLPGMAGGISPRFLRSTTGGIYPYSTTNNTLTITGNNVTTTSYYYFYDWQVVNPGFTCSGSYDSVTVTVNTNIGFEEHSESAIILYPNPAQNAVKIQFTNTAYRNLTVMDMSGQVLLKESTQQSEATLPLSSIAAGIYSLKIENDKSTTFRKLVIER